MLEKRASLNLRQTPDSLIQNFAKLALPENAILAGYVAIRGEMPVSGLPINCLPCIEGNSLVFRAWEEGELLVTAEFSTLCPAPSAPQILPDILLVPMVGFDRAKNRLGYGGGYYDRALASLRRKKRVIAVGVAHSSQETSLIPAHDGDQKMDFIITERYIV